MDLVYLQKRDNTEGEDIFHNTAIPRYPGKNKKTKNKTARPPHY